MQSFLLPAEADKKKDGVRSPGYIRGASENLTPEYHIDAKSLKNVLYFTTTCVSIKGSLFFPQYIDIFYILF
jgi:hypothetical protein